MPAYIVTGYRRPAFLSHVARVGSCQDDLKIENRARKLCSTDTTARLYYSINLQLGSDYLTVRSSTKLKVLSGRSSRYRIWHATFKYAEIMKPCPNLRPKHSDIGRIDNCGQHERRSLLLPAT